MDLKESGILNSKTLYQHWYYRAKSKALLAIIENITPIKILDIGAGSSIFSKILLDMSNATKAICVDISYSKEYTEQYNNKHIEYLKSYGAVDADLVLMMDILEHILDDALFLRDCCSKLRSGTFIVVAVPAFPFLWSDHDIFLEHKRRYTLVQLEQLLISNGLTLIKSTYFFGTIFPLAALIRLGRRFFKPASLPCSDLKNVHPLINKLLTTICSVEIPLIPYNRFFGLTAFCLVKKP
ncbi:MAG TPA: methyltransferase [Bacteroidales bacterium]|nr:methyltransferase [Bacteroidales bacterium]